VLAGFEQQSSPALAIVSTVMLHFKTMKINLLTTFLLEIQTAFGQAFSSDWPKFSDTKWTVKLINVTSQQQYFARFWQG